jgi:hypothetical protein
VKISVDETRDAFFLDVTKLDLPPALLSPGRYDVDVKLGGAEGVAKEPWVAAGPGHLRFRQLTPNQILTGGLVISPPSVTLGEPFTATATISNRGVGPMQGDVKMLLKGIVFDIATDVVVPARDPVTLAPGTLVLTTDVTAPTVGKGEPFQLQFDGRDLFDAKGTVVKPPASGGTYTGPLVMPTIENSGGSLTDWFIDGGVSNASSTALTASVEITVDGHQFGQAPTEISVPANNGVRNGFSFIGRDAPITKGPHVARLLIDGKVAATTSFTAK